MTLDGMPLLTSEARSGSETAKVDLWDSSWAGGGYYWTVVPVALEWPTPTTFRYRDMETPQDACQSGRVMRFGKASAPVATASRAPFASGLSPAGRLITAVRARDAFHGSPLVAWTPALGAHEYEIQWSRSAYPWRTVGRTTTAATSTLLPLSPGVWYYRVRGLNHNFARKPEMSWSVATRIEVAKPVFRVVR